jgi:hypothetical protein
MSSTPTQVQAHFLTGRGTSVHNVGLRLCLCGADNRSRSKTTLEFKSRAYCLDTLLDTSCHVRCTQLSMNLINPSHTCSMRRRNTKQEAQSTQSQSRERGHGRFSQNKNYLVDTVQSRREKASGKSDTHEGREDKQDQSTHIPATKNTTPTSRRFDPEIKSFPSHPRSRRTTQGTKARTHTNNKHDVRFLVHVY